MADILCLEINKKHLWILAGLRYSELNLFYADTPPT